MSSDDDMDARHGRMLAELAETGMDAVRRLSDALRHADSTQDLVLLSEAFHQVSRSVRQSIALEFKLRHAPREPAAPKPGPKLAASPPPERGDWAERADWQEYERADWGEPLDALLGDHDAIDEAVDASIARIRRGLGHAERPCPPSNHPLSSRFGRGQACPREGGGPGPRCDASTVGLEWRRAPRPHLITSGSRSSRAAKPG